MANTDVLNLDGDLLYQVEFIDTSDADGTPVSLGSFPLLPRPSPTNC